MSDPYNTAELEDKQSSNFLTTLKQGSRTPKQAQQSPTKSSLYEIGINHLRTRDIYVELDSTSVHCGHQIYMTKSPPPIRGISYPGWFMPLIPMFTNEDFARLEAGILSMPENPREFWLPLIEPKNDSSLDRYVQRLNRMEKVKNSYQAENKHYLGLTHDPEGNVWGKRAESPKAWIPDREWFSADIRNNLTFEDIFTLFPEAERNIFKLWLGRVALGRTNNVPSNLEGMDEPAMVRHTARMALVILGKNAGLGKSTLANYLLCSLNKVGHPSATFKSLSDRFGLKTAALSSILYKDDVSERTLKEFLSAEDTKILISNGLFQTEDKFVQAETIFPRCSILVNSNSWSANLAYDLDSGIQSRIKTVTTYTSVELANLKLDGISSHSPELRPYNHIPWLADKLNCDPEALFLWAARLAADEFYSLVSSDTKANALEERVVFLTSRLRYRFKSDILSALTQCMALCKIIHDLVMGELPFLPEFNLKIFYFLCRDFYFFNIDPGTQIFTQLLREHWEKGGRATNHPYQSVRDVRFDTFKQSLDWMQDNYVSTKLTFDQDESSTLKKFVSFLTMRDGFKLSGSIPTFIESWNNVRFQFQELLELATDILYKIEESHPESLEKIKDFCHNKIKTDDSWANDLNYSPDIAQKLREGVAR